MTDSYSSLSLHNVQKSYGDIAAVKGVSFDVRQGEIFGLIGPDGAGKTTIMRMVVSLLNPDAGEIYFLGKNVLAEPSFVRSRIGYMPQRFSLYRDLTVEENLHFFGNLFNISSTDQERLLKKLYTFSRLGPFRKRRADDLSGGMKQKLALSCMLMHDPQVLVLDEPTFGVDPVSRSEFWEILRTLATEGTAILVSTAYMDEASLCDRVGLMFEGQILALDTPKRLLAQFEDDLYLIETEQAHLVYEKLKAAADCGHGVLFGNGVHLTDIHKLGQGLIEKRLRQLSIDFTAVQRIQPELEDLFLRLIRSSAGAGE